MWLIYVNILAEFRVEGLGFRVRKPTLRCLGFRGFKVRGLGLRVWDVGLKCSRFGVQGWVLRFRARGLGAEGPCVKSHMSKVS